MILKDSEFEIGNHVRYHNIKTFWHEKQLQKNCLEFRRI